MPSIQEVMTPDPVVLSPDAPVTEAAQRMRDRDIGDVIVVDGDKVSGILTDRDIVVRVIAENLPPGQTNVGDVATDQVLTVSVNDTVDSAVTLMRRNSIRRVPVVDAHKPVGIVSLGDLAIEEDPNSALADISEAAPNN